METPQSPSSPDINNPTGEMVQESHGALLNAEAPSPTPEGNDEGGQAPAGDPAQQGQGGPAPGEEGPKMLDIEGYGQMSMEDIQSIFEQHNEAVEALERATQLDGRAADLDAKEKELADMLRLRDMISENQEIRSDLEKKLPEWKQILENKKQMESPAIKQIREELNELRQFKSSIENREAEVKINTIFEELGKRYPGVVDQNFRDTVLAQTVGAFQKDPSGLGPKSLLAVANATAQLVGGLMQKAEKNGQHSVLRAIKSQPPGTKLVEGGAAADATLPKGVQPVKTDDEFINLLAERALNYGQG